MSSFIRRDLAPYTPGEQPRDRRYIKLNTNESPFPPSPLVTAAVQSASGALNLYSDPDSRALRESIAVCMGVQPENVAVGNGSDEILAFCFMAFCSGKAVFPDISYGFYRVYCRLCGFKGTEIPLAEDYTVRAADYLNAGAPIFIANPNAPTGMELGLEDIALICRENPDYPVIIDEAYVDFGGTSALPLIKEYKNLIIVRTFSKSRNLAGARLGFAVADAELISDINAVRCSFNPYNINTMTTAAGMAALLDEDYFNKCVSAVVSERAHLSAALENEGFRVLPSRTNFLFASRGDGQKLYLALKDKGVLVRWFPGERTKDFIRITVGDGAQNAALMFAIKKIIADN